MSKDKTTEQPVPAEELQRMQKEADEKIIVKSDWEDNIFHERLGIRKGYVIGAISEYARKLAETKTPLPPSPVGETVAFAEWIGKKKLISSGDGFWYEQPEYVHEGQYGICVATNTKELYNIFAADRPNPSRAAQTYSREEVKQIAKDCTRLWCGLPSEFDKYFDESYPAKTERAGEISPVLRWVKASERLPVIGKTVIVRVLNDKDLVTEGKNTGSDFWEGVKGWYFDDTEWLEEAPPMPSPEVKEGQDFYCEQGEESFERCPYQCTACEISSKSSEPVKDTTVEQKVLHCQVYIEDGVSGCSTQCDHCREYYKPFSSPTERPAYVPDIKDILWDELAREYDDLNRMEENSWEWNRNILKQQYTIFRNTQGAVSDTKGEIPEEILQWIIAHPDADYVTIPGKYIGFEPIYWRGVMTLYRTLKGKEKELTEELAEIKLSFHQAVGEVKRLTTQLSGK